MGVALLPGAAAVELMAGNHIEKNNLVCGVCRDGGCELCDWSCEDEK